MFQAKAEEATARKNGLITGRSVTEPTFYPHNHKSTPMKFERRFKNHETCHYRTAGSRTGKTAVNGAGGASEDLEPYTTTPVTGTKELIERGKDADIIVVSNLPMNSEVIEGCKT